MEDNIRILIDKELKTQAVKALSELNLTPSEAIRMFLRHVVKTGELPFNPYKKEKGTKNNNKKTEK